MTQKLNPIIKDYVDMKRDIEIKKYKIEYNNFYVYQMDTDKKISNYLPKLNPTILVYDKAKRDYDNAKLEYFRAKKEFMKIAPKYEELRAHPNINKALRNYAKFNHKPVETVSIMDLEVSSAGVIGWAEAYVED